MLFFARINRESSAFLPDYAVVNSKQGVGFISRDETLMDVADLMQHYDRAGEKPVSDAVRTSTTLTEWLDSKGVSKKLTPEFG